jgi:L-iditol 2-dehydrogenase
MKAAVFLSPHHIQLQDLSQPTPGGSEVLVRVTACGVCGTDVHIYRGQLTQAIQPPVVLGHEIAGVIQAIGPDVRHLPPGQHVCLDPLVSCGHCQYCQIGRPNLCPNLTTLGYVRNGGYAQFVLAPASNVYPLRPDVPPAAGILVETLACVLNGFDKLALQPGRTAMILGAGTVGLLWNQLLRASPISLLVQSEPVPFRRDRARQLGADITIDPATEDLPAAVHAVAADGIDYIIDASGDPNALQQAIPLVKKGGTFLIFGVCPADATIRVNPHDIYQKEMRILGSKMPPHRLYHAAQIIQAGRIDHKTIVTDVMPLTRLPEALELFETARHRHVKIAIDPWAA